MSKYSETVVEKVCRVVYNKFSSKLGVTNHQQRKGHFSMVSKTMRRVQITFTAEEYARISVEADRLNISPSQYCKEVILKTDLSGVKSKSGSFSKNYAIVLSELKSYVKKHHGEFQLRDLKSWGNVTQETFDGDIVAPVGQKTAIGKAIAKEVAAGNIPNVRIATVMRDGEKVPKRDKYGVIIYEIYETPSETNLEPQISLDVLPEEENK